MVKQLMNKKQNITWDDLKGLKLYEDMVRKHGEKNAKQKIQWVKTIPYQNIRLVEIQKGVSTHCECGHAISNAYIVADADQRPRVLGSTCFMYLCDYLEINTSFIKEAETLLKNKLIEKEIKGKKYTIEQLKDILKEKKKQYRNRITEEDQLLEDSKPLLRQVANGELAFESAFPKMSKIETAFFKNYVTNKLFRYFVWRISWLGKAEKLLALQGRMDCIADKWMRKAIVGRLSIKCKEHLKIVMDDFIFSHSLDTHYLGEQESFFAEITTNPKFYDWLIEKQNIFWIGKFQADDGYDGNFSNNSIVAGWIRMILKGRNQERKLSEKQFKWCKEALEAFKGKTPVDNPQLAKDAKIAEFLKEHIDKIYNYGGSYFDTTSFVESIYDRTKNGLELTDYMKEGKRKGQRPTAERLVKYIGKNYNLSM